MRRSTLMKRKEDAAADLWGKLYALLCKWPSVQYGLGSMPESDQPLLDNLAEKIIIESGAFADMKD
jgi:hypothetical protein